MILEKTRQNYGEYSKLLDDGRYTVETKNITEDNVWDHFQSVINILNDGIELEYVQNLFITVIFTDGVDVDLTIFDYAFNLAFWQLPLKAGEQIDSLKLVFFDDVTKSNIKKYIDQIFLKKYRIKIPFKLLNNYIDDIFTAFRKFSNFQMYLANTLCLEDTIDLMNKYPEFNDTIHLDVSNVPLEDVKDVGMKATNKQIEYIKNSNHCLRDSFRTGEAISPKQYKEVSTNIGTKPNGQEGVYPYVIGTSFINGGLDNPISAGIESATGRVAQILQKTNVGTSGAFARLLGLNNIDTKLHDDENYSCNTKNYQVVTITSNTILKMFDMRWYKTSKNSPEYLLDADKDTHLIGQTLLFRSPMTCASFAAGKGICYKCYGNLAYVNRSINIGKIAAELLSSIYTQILLSAKHLLESLVVKMCWSDGFYDIFDVNFNTIQLKENTSYKKYTLVINPSEIYVEDEMDELDYNEYITSFQVITPMGETIDIHTAESDNIYLHPDFYEIISKYNIDIDDNIEIDMSTLEDLPILFIVQIKNNELSRTLKKVKNIINNKNITKSYDRNSILEAFINTNIEGGINLNSVHFEVLLANQIRAKDDLIDMPNWEFEDEPSDMLTLNESLVNNRSIAIRLQYSKISKALFTPSSFKINTPSNLDLYFMKKPQEFLESDESIVSSSVTTRINDAESNIVDAIHFFDEE